MKKICKIFITSATVGLGITFTLMIINAVMGLFIGLDFYLLLFSVLTAGFTIAFTLFDSNKIFCSKPKKVKQTVKSKTTVKNVNKNKIESYSKVRRKIS